MPPCPPVPVRILAALLVAWVPVAFALEASAALPRLVTYGWPGALVLAARVLATGLGIAAGRALWRVEPHARRLAQAWLVLDVAVTWLTLATPYFPSNRLPGTRAWEMAGVVALDGAWLVYLDASSRVRACWTSRALREGSTGGDDGLL